MTYSILIAEDEIVQREMMTRLLSKKLGYRVEAVTHGLAAVERVQSGNIDAYDAVILDIQMPQMDGFEALKNIRKYRPDLPVLMLTASDETENAVRAIKEGASDFIVKPPDPTHLDVAIKNAVRISTLARELNKLKRDKEGALSFGDLVGATTGLAQAVAYGRKAAVSNVSVLITGESGSGKELFARAIHGESRRVGAPFVALNCSAIPEHLVESTLFHPEKGAFRKAEGGTIFLDDIERLSQEDQVRLLRLLQHRDIDPGGSGKPIKVNVRVVAASEHDLRALVTQKRFREDLYFRLNILTIHLPPLRERRQDIIPLCEAFIGRICAAEGLLPKRLEPSARAYLMAQHWLGNVRELENLIHRAMVLADEDLIDEALLAEAHGLSQPAARAAMPTASASAATAGLQLALRHADGRFKTMDELEREILRVAMAHYSENATAAAQALGMAKSTLYRKLKEIE